MPTVLGRHPDGDEYRVEGELSDAPDWLIQLLSTRLRSQPDRNATSFRTDASIAIGRGGLEALRGHLVELDPRFEGVVGEWTIKGLKDGREAWVGPCPHNHKKRGDTDFLASIGVRTLVKAGRPIGRRGGKIVLCNPNEAVRRS